MEYYVYALKSINFNYIYVGQTIDLENRLMRHNSGRERTTRHYKPFKLIYFEQVESRILARQREKYLAAVKNF